jgi:hypothetical protein
MERRDREVITDEEYYNFVLTSGQEIKRRIAEEVMPSVCLRAK